MRRIGREPDGTPTAALMRLDGGHPAIDLLNTLFGPPVGPPDHDVLRAPEDVVTFARRAGVAPGPPPPASAAALRAARALRTALAAVLNARLEGALPPAGALTALERAARAALRSARLGPPDGPQLAWVWPAGDARAPVHRLALAAVALLADADELDRLHRCAGCSWLFLDHSRGAGRKWCSMVDCGSAAKQDSYVRTRRARRART
jgi:predicted RNA-binding Zn ribbon-like protein